MIKNYFNNLSIHKGIPKFAFIVLYISLLILGIVFIEAVEINYRSSYSKFFKEKVVSSLADIAEHEDAYEAYYQNFNEQLAETPNIKNLVFIIWSSEGNVLWHSNKLLEKIVKNDSIKSNTLFKSSNLLDIPEKKFKPYESFKLNIEKLPVGGLHTEFKKNLVHHFYKISAHKQVFYIEILREYHTVVPKNMYLYLLLGILLISSLLSYLSFLILRMYVKPVNHLIASMESYMNKKNQEMVNDSFENEFGKLIKTYNKFLHAISTTSENKFDDSDGKNQKVIDYLQEMLIKKSIRKSEIMELLIYPRIPENDFRMFVTIEEHDDVTFLLYVHFDINNIQSNLEKHIIQDKFKELSLKTNQMLEISEELFKDMVTHADLGPGFLLIRISGKEMEWVRSGPFHMYLVDSISGESSLLEGGVDYLPTEMVEENKIDLQSKLLLVVSDDILELLNVDAIEFNNLVVWFPEDSPKDGKLILSQILHNIDNINPDVLKQSPMLSLIRLK